ncbi:probable chitinase 10 [Uranotaenia lowii]|uniref:probable chitinase 10 n=1 Tax=Uranotaenia lowii TaxID=190385 RepID=UPI00247AA91D|nr:probable chitinase 10 [Uranotaenia lowii]
MKVKISILVVVALLSSAVLAKDERCPPTNEPGQNIHYAHPTDCHKYLTCNWGELVEQQCTPGLLWNDNAKYCDYPENVNCNDQSGSTSVPSTSSSPVPSSTVEVTSTTSAQSSTTVPEKKCPEQFDPDHQVFLEHEDCDKFYICTWNGQAVEKVCPSGLHWNQLFNICDWPVNVGCSSSPSVSPSTPSFPSTTPASTSSAAPSEGDCPLIYDPYHQVYFPHPDCTKYYICTFEGNKLEQNCPATLHWSQSNGYCDHPELAQCVPGVMAVEITDATTEKPKQCPLNSVPQDPPVYLPHENDCAKYYVCDHGVPVEMNCPAPLLWNAPKDVCDSPNEVVC